ncbi:MAG: SGNH/GDSL hydrolase family protein [Erysipelotrichaceae bacterium]|nr:SGNH/GDSL hydrolase family protein [Erysipelotrichaceae bacterium]
MNKQKTILLFLSLFCASCTNINNSEIISSSEESISSSSENIPSSEESSSEILSSDDTIYDEFVEIDDTIYLEVNERYSVKKALLNFNGALITSKDISIASYNSNTKQIIGKKVGSTTMYIQHLTKKQKINVEVKEIGTYSDSFAFDFAHLQDKNLVAFGDSVTADATLGVNNATYVSLFANHFNMNLVKNYAIGGTTATYMYRGSNIYKEYANNTTAIDGCRVVYNAYINGELDNIDYAFIAYGHNDNYFQPPLTDGYASDYCIDDSFYSCHSYKGSYRYMINVLKEANPNIRIIVLNCTYSKYCEFGSPSYGNTYSYQDYRNATHEVALEKRCRYIDPWDYLKDYYDHNNGNVYYKDVVHLSIKGHKILSQYIISQ